MRKKLLVLFLFLSLPGWFSCLESKPFVDQPKKQAVVYKFEAAKTYAYRVKLNGSYEGGMMGFSSSGNPKISFRLSVKLISKSASGYKLRMKTSEINVSGVPSSVSSAIRKNLRKLSGAGAVVGVTTKGSALNWKIPGYTTMYYSRREKKAIKYFIFPVLSELGSTTDSETINISQQGVTLNLGINVQSSQSGDNNMVWERQIEVSDQGNPAGTIRVRQQFAAGTGTLNSVDMNGNLEFKVPYKKGMFNVNVPVKANLQGNISYLGS